MLEIAKFIISQKNKFPSKEKELTDTLNYRNNQQTLEAISIDQIKI